MSWAHIHHHNFGFEHQSMETSFIQGTEAELMNFAGATGQKNGQNILFVFKRGEGIIVLFEILALKIKFIYAIEVDL